PLALQILCDDGAVAPGCAGCPLGSCIDRPANLAERRANGRVTSKPVDRRLADKGIHARLLVEGKTGAGALVAVGAHGWFSQVPKCPVLPRIESLENGLPINQRAILIRGSR